MILSNKALLLAVLGMAGVTYALRFLPLAFLSRLRLRGPILQFLEFFPVAVLAAFVVPIVLAPNGSISLNTGNQYLVASIITLPVAVVSRSLIATVIVGAVVMALLRLL